MKEVKKKKGVRFYECYKTWTMTIDFSAVFSFCFFIQLSTLEATRKHTQMIVEECIISISSLWTHNLHWISDYCGPSKSSKSFSLSVCLLASSIRRFTLSLLSASKQNSIVSLSKCSVWFEYILFVVNFHFYFWFMYARNATVYDWFAVNETIECIVWSAKWTHISLLNCASTDKQSSSLIWMLFYYVDSHFVIWLLLSPNDSSKYDRREHRFSSRFGFEYPIHMLKFMKKHSYLSWFSWWKLNILEKRKTNNFVVNQTHFL